VRGTSFGGILCPHPTTHLRTEERRLTKLKKRTPWVAALVLLLALWLASCGGGQAGGSGGQAGAGGDGQGGGGGSQTTAAKKVSTAHMHEKTTTAHKKAPTGGGASGGVIKTVTIKEVDFELSPSSVTLSKPGTYSFKAKNDGATQHSLEIEGKGLKSAGGQVGEAKLEQVLNPGQNGVLMVTFHKPGTYVMYCPIDEHEQLGMKGEVVIK
jgi:uncharacterized cupredoxin-like copper-binding protein